MLKYISVLEFLKSHGIFQFLQLSMNYILTINLPSGKLLHSLGMTNKTLFFKNPVYVGFSCIPLKIILLKLARFKITSSWKFQQLAFRYMEVKWQETRLHVLFHYFLSLFSNIRLTSLTTIGVDWNSVNKYLTSDGALPTVFLREESMRVNAHSTHAYQNWLLEAICELNRLSPHNTLSLKLG